MFRLIGKPFGIAVESVREVVPLALLDRPAQCPSFVEGVLNLGGRAVVVLRLDRLLGQEDGSYGLDASILVMRGEGEGALGLLVQHVDGVARVEDCSPMAFSHSHSFNGCVSDRLERGGVAFDLLSWPKLLLAEERLRLAEFNSQAQARLARLSAGPDA
jgi:purine-binding chemotaxis protein CheW